MDESSELVTANIVASGELNLELDLTAVAENFNQLEWIEEAEHSRRSGNRLLVRFKNNGRVAHYFRGIRLTNSYRLSAPQEM